MVNCRTNHRQSLPNFPVGLERERPEGSKKAHHIPAEDTANFPATSEMPRQWQGDRNRARGEVARRPTF